MGDRIYLINGWTGNSGECWYYNITTNQFVEIPNTNIDRLDVAVGEVDGIIYVSGGWLGGDTTSLTTVEAYDPNTNLWQEVMPMQIGRKYHEMVGIGNNLYTISGLTGAGWSTYSETTEILCNPSMSGGTSLDATCTVSFYLDDDAPENLIYQEHGVFVPSGGIAEVSFDWIPELAGQYEILIDITETNPSDYDLSNNEAYASIDILEPTRLKVMTYSDKQKYVMGDDFAEIIIKVTDKNTGEMAPRAMVLTWIIDPNGNNQSIAVFEISPGIYKGYYYFTNESLSGTYNIKATANIPGIIGGENRNQKDKFWYECPVVASNIHINLDSQALDLPIMNEPPVIVNPIVPFRD